MTKEDKELLLKDLCARLPYGVILNVTLKDKYDEIVNRDIELTEYNIGYITKGSHWIEYKPYLRPMSSMTEEERKEYHKTFFYHERYDNEHKTGQNCSITFETYDWLNKHHFDYRGLIEKGLALEAPEGMYKIK